MASLRQDAVHLYDWQRKLQLRRINYAIIAVALLIGCVSLAAGVFELWITQESRTWPHTQGVISESWWKSGTKSSCAVIKYKYSVAGQQYEENTLLPYPNEYDQATQRQKVDQYRVGSVVDVFYHPNHPQNSCLEVGVITQFPFMLFGVALLCFAVASSYAWRMWKERRHENQTVLAAPRIEH